MYPEWSTLVKSAVLRRRLAQRGEKQVPRYLQTACPFDRKNRSGARLAFEDCEFAEDFARSQFCDLHFGPILRRGFHHTDAAEDDEVHRRIGLALLHDDVVRLVDRLKGV